MFSFEFFEYEIILLPQFRLSLIHSRNNIVYQRCRTEYILNKNPTIFQSSILAFENHECRIWLSRVFFPFYQVGKFWKLRNNLAWSWWWQAGSSFTFTFASQRQGITMGIDFFKATFELIFKVWVIFSSYENTNFCGLLRIQRVPTLLAF